MLRFADYPVKDGTLPSPQDLPDAFQRLVTRMKAVEGKWKIFPESSRTPELETAIRSGVAELDEHLLQDAFDTDIQRSTAPRLVDVKYLVDQSLDLHKTGASEADWNCIVHMSTMEWARRCSRHENQTCWRNITTANIEPESLLGVNGPRRVDFGFIIRLEERLRYRLHNHEVQLNQTRYGPVTEGALVISVETKASATSAVPDAEAQLITWALAQIHQLHRLLQRAGQENVLVPPLPLLYVQGSEWRLWCLKDEADHASFYNVATFGNTGSVLGAYQAIAGLDALIDWAVEMWLPWLSENIVQPLTATSEGE